MNRSPVTSAIGFDSANDDVNNTVEIIVHIDKALDGNNRSNLSAAILKDDGIFSAEFCPLRYHLLLVQYDRTILNSREVLSKVVAQGGSAQIIGPI